jgi:release factor glutamine methyltransferase
MAQNDDPPAGGPPAPPYHPQVYSPEADSYLLLRTALGEVRPGDRVLEMGTGSGLIARALAEVTSVVAAEINPHAASAARSLGVEVVRTDLFAGICGTFDLILFNPPYLPTAPGERIDDWLEYALDGGETGREVIGRFIRDVPRVLSTHGRVLLLVSTLTGIEEVREICSRQGLLSFVVASETVEDERLAVLSIIRDLCAMRE